MQSNAGEIAPLFARQPILDNQLKTVGYELLFRSSNSIPVVDGDFATSQVILNLFAETTLAQAINGATAYINFSHNWLLDTPPFGPQQVVIEVLKETSVNTGVIDNVIRLAEVGYHIALDNFTFTNDSARLIPFASTVKVDVRYYPEPLELKKCVERLREYGVCLVADKIEDYSMYKQCLQLGFNLYQGFFFAKPELINQRVVPSTRMATLTMLSELMNPEVEVSQLEGIIQRDPVLAAKLLRLVNSGTMYVQIKSILCEKLL